MRFQLFGCISTAILLSLMCVSLAAQEDFRRGDVNADGVVDISDMSTYLFRAFVTGQPFDCLDAADVTDGLSFGSVPSITELVFLQTFLFNNPDQIPIPAPGFDEPGEDPTAPGLTCESYEPAAADPFATFSLNFELPESTVVRPGQPFDVFATLTTTDNVRERGAMAWSISIKADNLTVMGITTDGLGLPVIR